MRLSWAIAFFLLTVSLPVAAQPASTAQQDCAEAESLSRQTIRTSPELPDAYLELGEALICQQRFEDAIAAYEQAITHFQQDPELEPWIVSAYFGLAEVQVQQNQLEQAVSTYREAIQLDDIYGFLVGLFDSRHYSPLGEPITDGGMRGEGYSAAVRADASVDASAQYELGQTLVAQNRWEEAIAAYHQAISLSPSFAYAHLGLGQALYHQDEVEDAIASYREAVRLNPDLVWGYYSLGQALAKQDQTAAAIAEFQRVIGFHTGLDTLGREVKDNIAYSLLGDVLVEQDNPKGAIAAYRQAIELYPPDGFTRISLGRVLREQDELDEAIATFREALVRIPDAATRARAQAYTEMGKALMQQDRRGDAIAAFEAALSLDSEFTEAREQLQQARSSR